MSAQRSPLAVVGIPFALALASPLLTAPLSAQIFASERGMIAQTIDGTRITVEYARPRTRGRTNLYGGLEKWGTTWTPGADAATTLEINKPATILGKRIPKGKYSVWLVLREQGPWTFVLDPRDTLYHTAHPDSTIDQYRMPVMPQTVAHTEALTWSFGSYDISSTTLEMRWGTRGVTIPIEVTPAIPLTVTESDVAPLLGTYDFTWTDPGSLKPSTLTLVLRDNKLMGVWDTPQAPSMKETQLLRVGLNVFVRTIVIDGSIWFSLPDSRFVFTRENGVVTGFELRTNHGVDARGVRRR